MDASKNTRGKTAPNRLRRLDVWLMRYARPLLTRRDGPWRDAVVVDLGFGRAPWTTRELAARLGQVAPALRVVGVEIDPARVEAARHHNASDRVTFRCGGFDLPVRDDEPVRVIRAMNALRQYTPAEAEAVHTRLGAQLLPGGLVLEGTCDRFGRLLGVHVLRKRPEGLTREALILGYRPGEGGFAPIRLRDWLPQDIRRCVRPGHPTWDFFQLWTARWRAMRQLAAPARLSDRDAFEASARALANVHPDVHPDPWLWRQGLVVWRPAGGVPTREAT